MEKVLVFPAFVLEPYKQHLKDGCITDAEVISQLQKEAIEKSFLMERNIAEFDTEFKQIIPYCLLTNNGNVLAYQRTSKGGEDRLHHKWSIGIGGHINQCDGDYFDAVKREVREEVGVELTIEPKTIGIIYDDSNSVGQVHIGFVHLIPIESADQIKAEDLALTNFYWADPGLLENLEGWSTIARRMLN